VLLFNQSYRSLYCIRCRSGDSGLPASLQNVYRTPVHSSCSSAAVMTPGGLSSSMSSSSGSRVRWHRSCSVRETSAPAPIGPSEFVELYRSRAYSDPRMQDRNKALAERRRRVLHRLLAVCCLLALIVRRSRRRLMH